MKKILVIRFSSIGDIILTSPITRALKQQLGAEIHFVTKSAFRSLVEHNPNIDKVFHFEKSISEIVKELKAQRYDAIVDLHKNLRSMRLRAQLRGKTYSFNKLNVEKFIAVNFKKTGVLPNKHIVDRYFEGLASLGVINDGKGLECFIPENDRVDPAALFFKGQARKFIALVIGGSYYTKQIPINKLREICGNSNLPIVLLGGKDDKEMANELRKSFPHVINASGHFSVNQSSSIVSQAEWVISSDTGLMHVASAFNKKIISVWGNTIPRFGMYPYQPRPENKILEVNNLPCRPCSKLGFRRCPRGHFRCMQNISYDFVRELE